MIVPEKDFQAYTIDCIAYRPALPAAILIARKYLLFRRRCQWKKWRSVGKNIAASADWHRFAVRRTGRTARIDQLLSQGENAMEINRRSFLKKTSGSLAFGIVAGQGILRPITAVGEAAKESSEKRRHTESRSGDMLYRTLGRTQEKISVIGLGGYHIGKAQLSDTDSIKIIRTAIDRGITFMDNCWDYNDGNSEIRMGKALQDGY